MLIPLLATAAASDTRVEVTIQDSALPAMLQLEAHSAQVHLSRQPPIGSAPPKRTIERVAARAPLSATLAPLLALHDATVSLDWVTIRTFRTPPAGPDLLLQEIVMTTAALNGRTVTATVDDASVTLEFGGPCVSVSGFAYDAQGTQTHASTSVFGVCN